MDPEGVKISEVADFLGRSKKSVYDRMRRLKQAQKTGTSERYNFNGWTPQEITILKQRFIGGCSYQNIADELDKSYKAVASKARRLGLRNYNTKIDHKSIEPLSDGCHTVKEMARSLGKKTGTIYAYIKRHPDVKYKPVLEETRREYSERNYKQCQYHKMIYCDSQE